MKVAFCNIIALINNGGKITKITKEIRIKFTNKKFTKKNKKFTKKNKKFTKQK